jgi:RimJ/RimL family protein N-acetyltransferase
MNTSNLVIESSNLLIKAISLDYAEDIFKEFTPEIAVFMSPKPAEKIEETIAFIESSIKSNQAGTDFQTIIISKETKEFIGCTGLHHIDTLHPEFGVWLKKSAHGHGYGKEAILAMKTWADQNLTYEYLVYPVDKANIASCRIPESMGGKVVSEHSDTNANGKVLNVVEYRVYRS